MKKQYHILNGDALKEQFPKVLKGEIIVARECLVDGDVEGNSLDEFFKTRARFLSENYPADDKMDYFEEVVSEFNKIIDIQSNTEINLWFEDDLFCQVNFWFVCSLLNEHQKDNSIYLIRPKNHNQYGFGGLNNAQLIEIYNERIRINEVAEIASLWKYYQNNDLNNLKKTALELFDSFPFLINAVNAHVDRIPKGGHPGRPATTLIEIIKELKTKEFDLVFNEFCKRESIYGFGDVQVKRLFDEIINSK